MSVFIFLILLGNYFFSSPLTARYLLRQENYPPKLLPSHFAHCYYITFLPSNIFQNSWATLSYLLAI